MTKGIPRVLRSAAWPLVIASTIGLAPAASAQEAPPADAVIPAGRPGSPIQGYPTRWRKLTAGEVPMPAKPAPTSAAQQEKGRDLSIRAVVGTPYPAAQPPHPIMPAAGLLQPVPATPDAFPSPAAGDPWLKPASALVPRERKEASATASGSSGLILWQENPPVTDPGTRPPALFPTRLRQQIATACGKEASEVEVRALGEKCLAVRLKARSKAEADLLCARIFQLRELEPYQVTLDVPLLP